MSDGERNGVAMWEGATWHPTSTSDGVYWLLKEETKQNKTGLHLLQQDHCIGPAGVLAQGAPKTKCRAIWHRS